MTKVDTAPCQELALAGFTVKSMTKDALNMTLKQRLLAEQQCALFFANTNFVVQCQSLREQMASSNVILVNDGIGIDIASKIVHGQKFTENLCGSDYIPQFLAELKEHGRVFLFGGKPGIAKRAADELHSTYGVNIVGTANGYDEAKDTTKLIETINASKANIVLVAMGNPIQEAWILRHQSQLNVQLFMAVGAFLDFMAGDKPRAPLLIRRLRLEWLYRLSLEPKRLVKRYTWDFLVFLRLCLNQQKSTDHV